MSETTVEKDWTTAAGFRAVVLMTSMGHRCGYVGLPAGHALHGVDYDTSCAALKPPADDEPVGKRSSIAIICAFGDASRMQSPEMVFNVHGSITYAGGNADYPAPSDGLWWYGYDCAHAGDGRSPEYIAEQMRKYPEQPFMWGDDLGDEYRDLDYCVAECESLASQIAAAVQVAA